MGRCAKTRQRADKAAFAGNAINFEQESTEKPKKETELPNKQEYYALASIQALDAENLEASVQEIYYRVYPTGFKLSHHYIRSFLTK